MVEAVLTPEQVVELKRLYARYPVACGLALDALKTDLRNDILEGMPLKRFLALAENVAAIVRRIRVIQGSDGN